MSTFVDNDSSDIARPAAPLRTDTFRRSRPDIVGSEAPESPPYPIYLLGTVEKGFGRGGKDLGCPTANLSDDALEPLKSTSTGIYFGYARVLSKDESSLKAQDLKVWPMVMSLGYNPFYKNEKMTAEVHIMHEFESDFYHHQAKVVVLGYIRPELDYTSREALIEDIEMDKRVALMSLDRPEYAKYSSKI